MARTLNRLGLGRLRNLEPKPPVQRYERQTPGDLIHIDVKKLARFRQVGHRITGNRQQGRSTGVGYDRVHVAIDDTTRLAYVEVLPDEQQATAIGFMNQTLSTYAAKDLLTAASKDRLGTVICAIQIDRTRSNRASASVKAFA